MLEAELIRIHKPKYNIRLKDDRSPLYIHFTKEQFPRVLIIRKTDIGPNKKGTLFGPFLSGYQTRLVLKRARKAFPFCNQKKTTAAKPCFYLHLGLCPGACTGSITVEHYKSILNNLKLFLKGKRKSLENKLVSQMKQSAKNLDFETAAEVRDTLTALQTITAKTTIWQNARQVSNPKQSLKDLWNILSPYFAKTDSKLPKRPYNRIEAYDISNLKGQHATASMVVFTEGKPDKSNYRKFKIRSIPTPDDAKMIKEAITRRLRHREWKFPDLILVDGGKGQVKAAKQALSSVGMHHRINLLGLAKRYEQIIIYKHDFHTIKLKKSSDALQLLMHLRDEAHRFAKIYHKQLRNRVFLS